MIRTDKWLLQASPELQNHIQSTIEQYRGFCRALSVVILNNWPHLQQQKSFTVAVERLIHPTSKNPCVRHTYFQKHFYKFPSYLRRAAIEFVAGQVSSYLTRYGRWLDGERKNPTSKPPVFNVESGCYPAMYKGQMFKVLNDEQVELKLWNGKEWLWFSLDVKSKRERHLRGEIKSPALVFHPSKQNSLYLSIPVALKPAKLPDTEKVCAVDVGINTLATLSVISPDGTVTARKFIHPAADIDRRNKQARLIKRAARKTKMLSEGFCLTRHRKAQNINRQIAHITSKQIVRFALEQGANVIVFENLKGWRPTAGRKRSPMKQRFHQWLHRKLVLFTEEKFRELGGKVSYVYARGTSSSAFDGTGPLKRSKAQYELATFTTGKQYNCDLSASYNIGARYWAMKLKLIHCKDGQVVSGKSSDTTPRIPATHSTLWLWNVRCLASNL